MEKVLRSTGNFKNSFSVSSETEDMVDTGKKRNPRLSELDMIGSSAKAQILLLSITKQKPPGPPAGATAIANRMSIALRIGNTCRTP